MKRFSRNGNYSIYDYRAALERKKQVIGGEEYVDSVLRLINEAYANPTSAYLGLVRSILRECVTLETFIDDNGNEKLRVVEIVVPKDLKDVLPAAEKGQQKGE